MVLEKIRESGKIGYGFDAYKETYCDMIPAGIVDPTKVTRSALENAASIASTLLTTESLVADKPSLLLRRPAAPIWAECTKQSSESIGTQAIDGSATVNLR